MAFTALKMKDVTYGKKKREKGPGQSPEEHQPILRIQVEERKERRGGERKGREKRGEKGRREENLRGDSSSEDCCLTSDHSEFSSTA